MMNVGLFESLGLSPPRTHRELLGVMRKLARDTDGDGRLDHWALATSITTTWFERFYDFYPVYLSASGGHTIVEGGHVAFQNDAAVAAFELFRIGFAEHLLPQSNFSGRDPFVDGTVGMKIVGPWFIEQLERLKVPGLRVGVVPIPTPDGAAPDSGYAFADLKSVAVFSTTRHPEAAGSFVSFLASPDADRLLVELAGQLPYRRALARDPRFAEALGTWPMLRDYAGRVERARDLDVDADVVELLDILSEAFEASAIYGKVPPAAAVASAAAEAGEVLRAR